MKLVNHFVKALFAVLCIAAVSSCTVDNTGETGIDLPGGDIRTVSLSIGIPGAQNATRALADYAAECEVSDIDVLQFTGGKFAYRATGYDITGTGNERTFTARLLKGSYDLVVITNARTSVNNAVSGTGGVAALDEDTAIQDALDRLAVTVAKTDKISAGGILPALPMFGIVKGATVDRNLDTSGANSIKLVRMLSKIEVVLSAEAASGEAGGTGNDNFELVDARLYNQALKGWVAPRVSTWPANNIATAAWYGGAPAPAKAAYAGIPIDQPILYSGAADNVTANTILNSIYTFEAPAGSEAGRDTNVCLVVGGYYRGSAGVSYYRVDLRDKATGAYYAVLRNHNYTVNVLTVTGGGYDNPDDAFYGPARLEAEIVPWDLAAEKAILDGQWSLVVDEDLIELKGSGTAKQFSAETNYDISGRGFPAGLQIKNTEIVYTPASDNTWLALADVTGANGSLERTIRLSAPVNNASGAVARSAKIYLHAGNMTKVINVTQAIEDKVYAPPGVIGIRESELDKPIARRSLTLRGSSTYAGTAASTAATTAEFGALEDEPVYVVYYKWGSMIAMIGGTDDTWSADDVVWVNPGFTGTITDDATTHDYGGFTAAAVRGTQGAGNNVTEDPALGHGDPCAAFGTWRTPTGRPWTTMLVNGTSAPLGTYLGVDNITWSVARTTYGAVTNWTTAIVNGILPYGGAVSDDGSLYLPAAGYRNEQGDVYVQGLAGTYWSSTTSAGGSGGSSAIFVGSDLYSSADDTFFSVGFSVRCVRPAAKAPGILAAPGVLGYTADTHELTLRGSKEYSANADIAAAAEGMFPGEGLHDQSVYVAYFKFGSMVAIGSEPSGAFTPDDVIWKNPEFTGTISAWSDITPAATSGSGLGGRNDVVPNAELGHGDPCALMTEGGGNWKTPVGKPWNGGTFGAQTDHDADHPWATAANNAEWVTGASVGTGLPNGAHPGTVAGGDADWSMFLPAAGYRNLSSGAITNQRSHGYYWSTTAIDDASGYYMYFLGDTVNPSCDSYYSSGMAIRCVK